MKNGLSYKRIKGTINVPGDKSISHRAILLSGISRGKSLIKGVLKGDDCISTIRCMNSLGITVSDEREGIAVSGKGLYGLHKSESILNAGNSGTTMRLISGILAGQEFLSRISGDDSLRKRPMSRVIVPLRNMGAIISGEEKEDYAPLSIRGTRLKGIDYKLPIPSAQVKSAILLAGLYADNVTRITEPVISRDHTEIMLRFLGAEIIKTGDTIEIFKSELWGNEIVIPGDISSASFFIAPAAAIPGSELIVRGVGINPTRTGIIDVLLDMGADIRYDNLCNVCGEAVADIVVHGRRLHGTEVNAAAIPRMIDEIPILAVVAAIAEGTTVITGAGELRFKESDRIEAIVRGLGSLGIRIRELEDGIEIKGPNIIRAGKAESFGDHRIAMAMAVCGLFADGDVRVNGQDVVSISFPGFFDVLSKIVV